MECSYWEIYTNYSHRMRNDDWYTYFVRSYHARIYRKSWRKHFSAFQFNLKLEFSKIFFAHSGCSTDTYIYQHSGFVSLARLNVRAWAILIRMSNVSSTEIWFIFKIMCVTIWDLDLLNTLLLFYEYHGVERRQSSHATLTEFQFVGYYMVVLAHSTQNSADSHPSHPSKVLWKSIDWYKRHCFMVAFWENLHQTYPDGATLKNKQYICIYIARVFNHTDDQADLPFWWQLFRPSMIKYSDVINAD